jgi:hypothetical protein
MASNPFENRLLGLLGAVPVDRPANRLADLVSPPVSPSVRAIAEALLARPTLPVSPYPYSSGLAGMFAPPKPALPVEPPALSRLGGAVGALYPAPVQQPPSVFGALSGFTTPTPSKPVAPRPATSPATVKRRAFFSFHYDDAMRVNVVRNAWKITHRDSATMRSFQDSSLWEARKLTNDSAIKALIRAGVGNTSAVCVLVGSETWRRRWVRYEIARAIVDGRGLLAVHLNSIRHHRTLTAHTRGSNPLDYMAIGKPETDRWKPVRYYLYEKNAVSDGAGGYQWEWQRYGDYTDAVSLPGWVTDPAAGFLMPLSENADEYDYMAADGSSNIGSWLDRAAKRAGR